jgi:hypothetical protein
MRDLRAGIEIDLRASTLSLTTIEGHLGRAHLSAPPWPSEKSTRTQ